MVSSLPKNTFTVIKPWLISVRADSYNNETSRPI